MSSEFGSRSQKAAAIRSERLRERREQLGLSQRELARLCGLGEVQVHRYEKGVSEPSARYLKILAEVMDVSIDYLVGLSDNPHGQIGDKHLKQEELTMLDTYRREGWPGVIRLGADRLAK